MSSVVHRRGFTIVELLAAAVAAAVLAVAMGSVLYFSYAALRRANEVLALQRDLADAVDQIQRIGRSASPSEITIASGSITFGTNLFRNVRCRFYDNRTGDFVFDPNMAVGGDERTLIDDRLVLFKPSVEGSRIVLELSVITGAGQVLAISNSITMRN